MPAASIPLDDRFYYTIQSLRVDGDFSADPRDYADRDPGKPVGEVLIGWLWGHLDPSLSPVVRRERGEEPAGMRFRIPEGVILQFRPTPRDLARWAEVKVVHISCSTLRADGVVVSRATRPRPQAPKKQAPKGKAPEPGFVEALLARIRARHRGRT